jgi:hypothetical protein
MLRATHSFSDAISSRRWQDGVNLYILVLASLGKFVLDYAVNYRVLVEQKRCAASLTRALFFYKIMTDLVDRREAIRYVYKLRLL